MTEDQLKQKVKEVMNSEIEAEAVIVLLDQYEDENRILREENQRLKGSLK